MTTLKLYYDYIKTVIQALVKLIYYRIRYPKEYKAVKNCLKTK